jgi:hypothetical protein
MDVDGHETFGILRLINSEFFNGISVLCLVDKRQIIREPQITQIEDMDMIRICAQERRIRNPITKCLRRSQRISSTASDHFALNPAIEHPTANFEAAQILIPSCALWCPPVDANVEKGIGSGH